MENINIFFSGLYKNFNERKIDLVISKMTDWRKSERAMLQKTMNRYHGVEFRLVTDNIEEVY